MSNIHYFQRYSQKENIVTNNTMLLFSRLYHHDPTRFNRFLQMLLPDSFNDLSTEVQFHQQKKMEKSIPDAMITQPSVKVIIETKLYGQEDLDQIKNHCASFGNEDIQILLLINRETIDSSYEQKVINLLNEINIERDHENNILLASTTFKEICKNFYEVLTDFDQEMQAIIKDYESFCLEEGLIDNARTKMRAVSVGDTLEQNLQYNLYYAPTTRGYQNHKYLGLYNKKAVRALGEVIAIADITYDVESEQLMIDNVVKGKLTAEQKSNVKNSILEAKDQFGYFIAKNHRFFFVEQFYETMYRKTSKHGLLSFRYFDLAENPNYTKDMSVVEVAELLRHDTWE